MLIEHIIQKFFEQDFCYLIGSKPKVVLFQDSFKGDHESIRKVDKSGPTSS